jgi:hypothetical protein
VRSNPFSRNLTLYTNVGSIFKDATERIAFELLPNPSSS